MTRYIAIISFLIIQAEQARAQSHVERADSSFLGNEWYFSLTNDFYFGPGGGYFDPCFSADRGHLHLEARYNMEDYQTGSLWYGYNMGGGSDKFGYYLTPMVGLIFGNTDGIAPDLILDVYYGRLDFYTDNEYLFDFSGIENSYFYTWTELTYAPFDWTHFGVAMQRTKIHQQASENEYGFTLGFNYKFLYLTGYIFNPAIEEERYGFLSLGLSF